MVMKEAVEGVTAVIVDRITGEGVEEAESG